MSIFARAALADLQVPAHGGLDHAELEALGIDPDRVVDFSANLNPWGAPPSVPAAIAGADISRYPDGEALALRRALATAIGVPLAGLILGNGSSELLWMIALAFIDPGERVLIVGPTFGEYERAARLAPADILVLRSRAEDGFHHDLRHLTQAITHWRPKVTFLCNPNNPTGEYLDHQSVAQLTSAAADSLLVLDEAYVGFVSAPWSPLDLLDRGVLVLRSLTKDYGLAGLRLGYAVGAADTIAALQKVRPPWNVNAAAQAAGIACIADVAHVATARRRLADAKEYLIHEFAKLGLRAIPSATSFFLLEVGDARSFRAALLRQGLLVRDCTSFGLPRFVRIAARTLPECERLIAAVRGLGPQEQWRP